MFKRIDHVEIVTAKPEETERFYIDVLGFRLKARDEVKRPDGSGLDLTYLDLGGTTVELIHFTGVPVGPMPEKEHLGYRLIALEVDDMKQTLAELKERGIEPVWGPMFRPNYARAEIQDPNGYHIELRHWF